MCSIYGVVNYGKEVSDDFLYNVVRELGISGISRGNHATGIAYFDESKLVVNKKPVDACKFEFELPKSVNMVIGHTRWATHGDPKVNKNNHPFGVKLASGESIAFAHNGIIHNTYELEKQFSLEPTKIKCDSWILGRLLELETNLNNETIQKNCKRLSGTFNFNFITKDKVYLLKHNNPLALYDLVNLGLLIFASTDQMLKMTIKSLEDIYKIRIDCQEMMCGENQLISIDRYGFVKYEEFKHTQKRTYRNWDYFQKPKNERYTQKTIYDDDDDDVNMAEYYRKLNKKMETMLREFK